MGSSFQELCVSILISLWYQFLGVNWMVVIVIYIAYVKVVYGVNKSLLTGSSPTSFMF